MYVKYTAWVGERLLDSLFSFYGNSSLWSIISIAESIFDNALLLVVPAIKSAACTK